MGASVTYPDGSILLSSALTLAQINAVLQPLTLEMLGLADSASDAPVRIEYPAQGAPFQNATDDVCYLRSMLKDDPYDKIRDRFNWAGNQGWGEGEFGNQPFGGTASLVEQWNYTRLWSIHWCFYGPNSLDRARILRSGLYQDFFTDALSLSQLFPMSEFKEPVRAPEQFNGQWWERCDFDCEMYEFVTESLERQTVASAEIIVENASGVIADVTVTGG